MNQPHVYRYWTKKEEKTIISCVKSNPENLTKAFECAAEVINRSKGAVSQRYYKYIRSTKEIFITSSNKSTYVNRKNLSRRNNQNNDDRVEVFANMFRLLSTDEKARILMSML